MLGLGKSDPAKDMQRKLDDARDLRGKHVARRDAAIELVGERREELQQAAAAAAPDALLDKAEGKLTAAERRVATLEKAIADCDREIADYETQLAAIVDGNQRSETARKLEAVIAGIVECEPQFYTICEKLNRLAAAAAVVVPEAAGIDIYLKGARAELPPAWELVLSVLKGRVRSVLAGHGPAHLPTDHPAPTPPLANTQPAMLAIFVTKPIAWRAQDGSIVTWPAWFECQLCPEPLARRALDINAALPFNHPTAKEQRNARRSFIPPDVSRCILLDDPGTQSNAEQPDRPKSNGAGTTLPQGFEPLDRGEPYKVAVGGAA